MEKKDSRQQEKPFKRRPQICIPTTVVINSAVEKPQLINQKKFVYQTQQIYKMKWYYTHSITDNPLIKRINRISVPNQSPAGTQSQLRARPQSEFTPIDDSS